MRGHIAAPWRSHRFALGAGRGNRRDPEQRTVYEVKFRYFLPQAHGEEDVYVALVVEPRPGTHEEIGIVCIS